MNERKAYNCANNIIHTCIWLIFVLFLIMGFTTFGFYSTKTRIPERIHSHNPEQIDYLADKNSNYGQEPKIIYGKGSMIRKSNIPSKELKSYSNKSKYKKHYLEIGYIKNHKTKELIIPRKSLKYINYK